MKAYDIQRKSSWGYLRKILYVFAARFHGCITQYVLHPFSLIRQYSVYDIR